MIAKQRTLWWFFCSKCAMHKMYTVTISPVVSIQLDGLLYSGPPVTFVAWRFFLSFPLCETTDFAHGFPGGFAWPFGSANDPHANENDRLIVTFTVGFMLLFAAFGEWWRVDENCISGNQLAVASLISLMGLYMDLLTRHHQMRG